MPRKALTAAFYVGAAHCDPKREGLHIPSEDTGGEG
jgi:hypothetical protein